MDTKQSVRAMLQKDFGLDPDVGDNQALFSSNVLDSLNSVQLLLNIQATFNVEISPLDVTLDDIDSVDKITETIEGLQA